MSDPTSSSARLALDVILGPLIALINQAAIYSGATWACGHGARGTLHIIPALCLSGALIVALDAHGTWRRSNREEGQIARRTRFFALVGAAIAVFSAFVVVAQWAGLFTFDACMKA